MSGNRRAPGESRNVTDHDNEHVNGNDFEHYMNNFGNAGDTILSDPQTNRRDLLKLSGSAAISLLSGCAQLLSGEKTQGEEGTIEVTPSDGLMDDPFEILLSDFDPNEMVTIRAHTVDGLNRDWLSFGRFKTSSDGTLSLAQRAPISGTYESIDPRGLLWSMQVPDKPNSSFTVDEVYDVHVSVQRNNTTVASTTSKRRFIAAGVTEHSIDEDGFVGVFFEPSSSGPHPAVLALHGTEGQVPWLLGAMLASHGYATLALQYFDPTGTTGLPSSLVEIPLEYFERAIDWVLARPSVTGDRVGVVGPSIGGELTLLLGATLSRIGVVVGYVPSSLVWEGPGGERPMWTYEGEAIPFVRIKVNRDILPNLFGTVAAGVRGRPIRVAELFHPSFENIDPESDKAGIIPVEEIDGPVLLISGKDDGIWPSTAFSEIAIHRLQSHDHPYPFEHLAYENAGHIISVPSQPTADWDAFKLMQGMRLEAGGTAPGNAHAAADSWPRVLDYLAEGLR